MDEESRLQSWITIRVGRDTLSFALPTSGGNVDFEPYVVTSGISIAANLREAFKTSELLTMGVPRARIMVDSPVLMVPVEKFDETQMADLYHYTFPDSRQDAVAYNVLPDLNAVALFAMNKDLRLVIDDHFRAIKFIAAVSPVWRHLHQRSYTGARSKLYGYFHERQLEVFSFQQNRFKYSNAFEASRLNDSLYFLLYVWKQLQLASETDELHLCGNVPEADKLVAELKKYVKNVYLDEDNNR